MRSQNGSGCGSVCRNPRAAQLLVLRLAIAISVLLVIVPGVRTYLRERQ